MENSGITHVHATAHWVASYLFHQPVRNSPAGARCSNYPPCPTFSQVTNWNKEAPWCCVNVFSCLTPKQLHSFILAIDFDQGMNLKLWFCDNLTTEQTSTVSLTHRLPTYCMVDSNMPLKSLQAFMNDSYWNSHDTLHYIIPVQETRLKCSYSSYQKKSWADKFPAQPPIESWLKAHHSLDIFTEAVHTWKEHEKLHTAKVTLER